MVFTNVPVYSTTYSEISDLSFFFCCCFHNIINKFRYSPSVAPMFSNCESSTHTVAFDNVNTSLGLKKQTNKTRKTNTKSNRETDGINIII